MKPVRTSLRYSLPAVMLVSLLLGLGVSLYAQLVEHESQAYRNAEAALQLTAEHLGRVATRQLPEHPERLSAEVALEATDARAQTIAVLDAEGRIVATNRANREKLLAAEALPGFVPVRFSEALATQVPVLWREDGGRVLLAQSFDLPRSGADEATVRSLKRGVVWVDFDLQNALAVTAHRAVMDQLLVVAGALLLSVMLATVLRRQVTRPLSVIGRASQELAAAGRLTHPVPEIGPTEIRSLARHFNDMARQIQAARDETDAARARTSALVESAMDAILTIDEQRRIVMANRSAAAMFGVEERDLLGQPIEVLLPERYRAHHPDWVHRFAASGVTSRQMGAHSVVHGRRWNGEEFPAEASISHSRVGGAEFFTVILRDVTERLRNEEAIQRLNASLERTVAERTAELQRTAHELERERERLARLNAESSLIFESATVGILLTKNRHVLRCNRMLEQLLGYEPGEAVGHSTRDWFVSPAEFDEVGEVILHRLGEGGVHVRDLQFQARTGRRFWARLSARRFGTQADGTILSILEDVSAEHAAAEAMQAAKAEAESASQAKSSFLANMSHEIRTPMNAIIGMTHLALRTPLSDQQRDYLGKIQLSAQHLLGVINDILDFSKVEAGKLTLERIDFQLLPVLDNVFTLIRSRATEKGLELVLDVGEDVPNFLVGDPLRLGQVLINLGSNAVKFTERGEVVVRVRRLPADAPQVRLQVEVQDTGLGLSEEQQAHLFQSFHQADASISRHFGGTGLGLAISQRLVHLMGGDIGVRSTLGRGATFSFTVQLEAASAPDELPPIPGDPAHLRGRRVLVVDDNASAREVAERLLASLGMHVATAHDGDDAVDAVQRADRDGQPFDVVLLDWSMPRMDGIEAGRQIRALPLAAPPRLMLITGRGREEVLRDALESGFSTVMVKPVNASVLLDNLLLSLCPHAAPANAPAEAARPEPLARGRALVVEDNAINQQIAREMLQDLGLTVEVAENGLEALDRLDRAPAFDLVFMDMHMPVMDGITATRRLREDPRWATLPVVAMTANVLAEDRERCMAAGMNDFVAKPVDAAALIAAVRRWLPDMDTAPAPPSGPVPVANDARLAPLQGIPGLDLRDGLRRCGDKAELYLSLLRRFVAGQAETLLALHQIEASVRNGGPSEVEALRLRAHSLKGVAGSLGATLLFSRCEALERRLREGATSVEPELSAVESTLRRLGEDLQAALGPAPEDLVAVVATGPLPALDLAPLRTLLLNGDPDAVGWADAHGVALHRQLGPDAALLLARIRNFDYDQALALLAPPDGLEHP